jgi:DNA-directed RNA polymerase subunit E'/Rpb7
MSKLVTPYINTILNSDVTLQPRQMDNNLYKHLKSNLIEKLEGRCYINYGYITKIHRIMEYGEGKIPAENPMASAIFNIKFSCRLCNPLKNQEIICKIEKINNILINAVNGPMLVIIKVSTINLNTFLTDNKTGKLYYVDKKKKIEITNGVYIKVTVDGKTFNNMDKVIMVMGLITGIASPDEIKQYYIDEYINKEDEQNLIEYESYIKGDIKKIKNNENIE